MEVQTFSWYKNYPEGVPHEINPHQFESLVDLLEHCIKEYGPLDAFTCMGASITFDELDRLSRNFAAYLQQDLKLLKGSSCGVSDLRSSSFNIE